MFEDGPTHRQGKANGYFLQIFVHNIKSNVECKKLQGPLCDEGVVLD